MSELLLFRRREESEQRQGSERGGGGKNATNREANSASVLGSTLSSFDDLYELVYLHVVVRLPRKHLMTLPIFFPCREPRRSRKKGAALYPMRQWRTHFCSWVAFLVIVTSQCLAGGSQAALGGRRETT